MKKSESREHKMKLIFAAHPETKGFHVTSDDQAFTEKNDADNHAKTLDDKDVEYIPRAKPETAKKVQGDEPTTGATTAPAVTSTDPAKTVKKATGGKSTKPELTEEQKEKATLRDQIKAKGAKVNNASTLEQLRKQLTDLNTPATGTGE